MSTNQHHGALAWSLYPRKMDPSEFVSTSNRSMREVHPLPTVDETLAQLSGARVFSKLDANSGFWQIPLTTSSKLLTTFLTHNGRYCFNKMPFGISTLPEENGQDPIGPPRSPMPYG